MMDDRVPDFLELKETRIRKCIINLMNELLTLIFVTSRELRRRL